MQYLLRVDLDRGALLRDIDLMVGAPPHGAGLQEWLKRSPTFNADRITAPLQVVAKPSDILNMWEPYAVLRVLKKPVDLMILNTSEHVLTNPGARLASQGGTVDWFRFWLQNYEDSDPAKQEQYTRWESMRAMKADYEDRIGTTAPPRLAK